MVDLFNTKPVNDEGTDKFKDYAKSTKVYWIAAFCIIVGIGVSIATGIVVSILQADASLTETQLNR
ncbi:hypothetical protein DPMN_053759 [Dreissena polymorpha]|uniref:Uncharacterized protein n=1 Tax=Dreissena polymorpha TaxID=45954 RepID=A0A9D4CNE9_DREPO|nr:hypothetical protein DPMN_053759 [Dreissena polymorpha]